MPNTIAQVMMNYGNNRPIAGAGLATGMVNLAQGVQRKKNNKLLEMEEERRKDAQDLESRKHDDEQRQAMAKRWAGVAGWANTPEKWAQAQAGGYLPKELSYENREPFIMGVMTETERLNREKQKYQEDQDKIKNAMDEREFGLEREKFQETKRKNRQDAAKAGETGSNRPKIAEENGIYNLVARQFQGEYNPVTGQFMGFKDDRSSQQAQKISTDAVRLYQANPTMSASMAVSEALQRNGIDIGQFASGNQQQPPMQAPPGAAPGGGAAQFNYVPGQGLVPVR